MPASPKRAPLAAADCQVWETLPGGQVAAYRPAVGTTQLTSPTSVDAMCIRVA